MDFRSLLHFLYNLWCTTFFQPDPKFFPDPDKFQDRYTKNKVQGTILCSVIFLHLISTLFLNYSKDTSLEIASIDLLVVILFLSFCRTRPFIFYFSYTCLVSFGPWFLMQNSEDLILFHLGIVFFLAPFIFLISDSLTCFLVLGISQALFFQTKHCEDLVLIVFQKMEPRAFVTKFVQSLNFSFIISLVAYFTYRYLLQRKTKELIKTHKNLQKALEQQKNFILSFSHELRNPIHSLLGNLQMVILGAPPEKALQMVKTARICGELLMQFINNVLDTGKLDMGNFEVLPIPTRTHELFRRIWMVYQEIIQEKRLKGSLKIENKVCPLMLIDPHRVNQLLLNLIGNAVKFTAEGSIQVTVEFLADVGVGDECFEPVPYDDEGIYEKNENLQVMGNKWSNVNSKGFEYACENNLHEKNFSSPQKEPGKGVLKVIVKDTGCGMTPEELGKLFGKFSQVSQDPLKTQIGTGLGLFITKKIVEGMNGEIRVYSKPGLGSAFVVCLPVVSLPVQCQAVNKEAVVQKLVEKRIRALVADDSPFSIALMQNYFAKIGGVVVASVDNGYQVYSKYIECLELGEKIDVITLDDNMPIMNGKVAYQRIRKYEQEKRLKPVKIIMISGDDANSKTVEFQKDVAKRISVFLKKPVALEDFFETLYKIC